MPKSFVLFCSLILTFNVLAQGPKFLWAKGIIGDDQNASAMGDISMDKDKNMYLIGTMIGSVDLDPGPGTKNYSTTSLMDAYITKYDSAGNQIWIKVFQNNSIVRISHTLISDDNFLFVAGDVYKGSVDLDPNGPGGYHSSGNDYNFTFIAKFDLAGNYIHSISLEGGKIFSSDLIQDKNGSLLITGYMDGVIDFDGDTSSYNVDANGRNMGYIAKYDRNLKIKWAYLNCETNGSAYNSGLRIDKENNYYLAGYFSNFADFRPGPVVRNYYADAPQSAGFIQKLDSNANLLWVETIGGTAGVLIRGMDVDSNGNSYVTGTFNDSVYFKSFPRTIYAVDWTNIQYQNGFIAKYDSYGDYVWSANMKSVSEVISSRVTLDHHGNVIFGGTFKYTMDLDPGPATYNVSTLPYISNGPWGSVHYDEIYLVSLNESGQFNWGRRFGGRYYDRIGSIFTDEDQYLYTTGMLRDSADVDPGIGIFTLNTQIGKNAGFLQKLCLQCECVNDTIYDTVNSCAPYNFGTQVLKEEGNYTEVFKNFDGCDSTVHLSLTIKPSSIDTIYVSSCEKFKFARKTYKESGIYRHWYWNQHGCDSIVYLDLTINKLEQNEIKKSIEPNINNPFDLFYLNSSVLGLKEVCWEVETLGEHCESSYSFNLRDTGYYYVIFKALDTNGCSYSDTTYIQVEHESIFIPNSFTPNGDEINAVFEPRGFGIESYSMIIFDRWGEIVFQSQNQGWKGDKNSKECPQDMYLYKINLNTLEGKTKEFTGAIYLIR